MNRKIYLSEHYSEIPSNCVFNKVATGCGGTTLEIENRNRNSIITVPLAEMIDNKANQYPNDRTPEGFRLLGVKEGVYKADIVNYLKENKIHKIIVTYDSLPKVIEAIEELNQQPLNEYFLLIDEVHYIMNNYTLRKDAVRRLLETYKRFDRWCFMTATPNEDEFTLEELKDVPVEVAKMPMEKIRIHNVKTVQVEATTRKLIRAYLGKSLANAHIFVNSVEFIASMIKACGLTDENCKAVWSKGNKSYKDSIQGISRSAVGDPAKKINFYTSTCFEGSDISDPEGQYIIVSDGKKAHTLNDISTSLRQIMGRVRDTKYRNTAIHILNTTKYSGCRTYDEYKMRAEMLRESAERMVEAFNGVHKDSWFSEEVLNEKYITRVNGVHKLDVNLIMYDLMKYKLAMETYSTVAIVQTEQSKAGIQGASFEDSLEPSDLIKMEKGSGVKFAESFEEYANIQEELYPVGKIVFRTIPTITEERLKILEDTYPFLKEAYTTLGADEVRRLKYNQTNIKKALIVKSDLNHVNKIAQLLSGSIKVGNWYSIDQCTKIIEKTYKQCGIPKTPKAVDMDRYYGIEPRLKRIDGRVTSGYDFVMERYSFN